MVSKTVLGRKTNEFLYRKLCCSYCMANYIYNSGLAGIKEIIYTAIEKYFQEKNKYLK